MNKGMYEKYDMITIDELREMLGISRNFAYRFIKENNIKHIRIGHRFFIKKASVEKLLSMED